jgi:NAD(P)-dependent dehydrogenase (short-subunit alcohol dehydrogenase family)
VARVALVQGANRGLGLEFVGQLAAAGTHVIATCRRPKEAQALAALAASNAAIDIVELDVADEASIAAAADAVAQRTNRLDLLINCAGLLHGPSQTPERRLSDVKATDLLRSFGVNAIGPILMARYFEQLLGASARAVFASLSARVGSITDNRLGGWYAYRASKAAQNMLLKTLSIEWSRRSRPIVCLALHPGTVATELSAPFTRNIDAERLFSVERAARQLLTIIDAATPEQTGSFIAWNGEPIPW